MKIRERAIAYLAGLLGVTPGEIGEALILIDRYHLTEVPKKSGGVRRIAEPPAVLKRIQQLMLHRFLPLIKAVEWSGFPRQFQGFLPGRSIKTNAEAHLETGNRFVLRLDLKNAFDRVYREHFEEYLEKLCDAIVARRELVWVSQRGNLHTKATGHGWRPDCLECVAVREAREVIRGRTGYDPRWIGRFERRFFYDQPFGEWWEYGKPGEWEEFLRAVGQVLLDLCFFKGSLPQGAPTSPMMLNLSVWFSGAFGRLEHLRSCANGNWRLIPPEMPESFLEKDLEIWHQQIAEAEGAYSFPFVWTVYADDFTFSAPRPFSFKLPDGDERSMEERLIAAIEENGKFKVNRAKTRRFDSHACAPLVTGLRLTKQGKLALPKEWVRFLRSLIHHASRDPERRAELAGHLAYIQMIYGDKLPRQLRLKL